MNFSNKFKQIYWWILLAVLSGLCIWRLVVGSFLNFDIYLFIVWFIIVLFPIISEISVFGLNVKKDIDSAKNEIKSQLSELRNTINNSQNQTVNVHTIAVPAKKEDIEEKKREEISNEKIRPESKNNNNSVSISKDTTQKKIGSSEKAKERQDRISKVEKLVNEYFISQYGESYKPQIKIEDVDSGAKVVTDAVIQKSDNKIAEIIEIKLIGEKSPDSFYFATSRFIQKLQKLGIKYPLRFVVVSEFMDKELAGAVKIQIHHFGSARSLGANIPKITAVFFKLNGEYTQIEEIKLD